MAASFYTQIAMAPHDPNPLDAVGDPELRRVLLHLRAQPVPQSADDIAAALGFHRNVARSRLERLANAGLLTVSRERRTSRRGPGAGRPTKLYAPAPELEEIEFPARRYASLVSSLIEQLPPDSSVERLRSAGESFGATLAGSAELRTAETVQSALEELCAGLGRLGFQAAVESIDDTGAVLITPTCPLRPVVNAVEAAVDLDRGMWSGLLAATLHSLEVESIACDTSGCAEEHSSCRVRLGFSVPL
ncbi:MAG TPA: hypothetical protein VGM80_03310 [Gaiellaceae bacterium]|jgi:predicted ArsR family transcriptional regulator